jgi:hypothetical protein
MGMEKVLITGRPREGTDSRIPSNQLEYCAALEAGFTVLEICAGDILTIGATRASFDGSIGEPAPVTAPMYDLRDKSVFLRYDLRLASNYKKYARNQGGSLLVSDAEAVDAWYKVVPADKQAAHWLGGRTVGWAALPDTLGKHDPEQDSRASLTTLLNTIYADAPAGQMFLKAPTKLSLASAVYSRQEAEQAVSDALFENSHVSLSELIYAQPMDIAQRPTDDFPTYEYRCLMVGDECSTVSLTTDIRRPRNYRELIDFANDFATAFKGQLPRSYCLDIARLASGQLAVVELNDIQASGFFADNDHYQFYRDVFALADLVEES